jgi:hypothetical protein
MTEIKKVKINSLYKFNQNLLNGEVVGNAHLFQLSFCPQIPENLLPLEVFKKSNKRRRKVKTE